MSIAKYSPTVNFSYRKDQDWFIKNGGDFGNGDNKNSFYDNDGFDSYGYNENDIDRAGVSSLDYEANYKADLEGNLIFEKYESVLDLWSGRDILAEKVPNRELDIKHIKSQLLEIQKIKDQTSLIELKLNRMLDSLNSGVS